MAGNFWAFRVEVSSPGTPRQFILEEPWATENASQQICDMELRADPENKGIIVIGDNQIDATEGNVKGVVLLPGERMELGSAEPLNFLDAVNIYIDARISGPAVCGVFITLGS